MEDRKKGAMFLSVILAYYLVTRLWGISSAMNEYFDYDEGTYLMMARFINHGVLPYRDIYAVHPPFYYYLLALWLRIFGDSYVVGRLLSVFLGLLAVLVAYLVGRELRGWKTGVLLSALVAMDPIMVHMNGLVFHETTIELFTLLSLYYFVRYVKQRNRKDALWSLFWVGVGSTSKFTILPYAAALYVVLVLFIEAETESYLDGLGRVLLNRVQVFLVLVAYGIMSLFIVGAVMLYPSDELRHILILPGVHWIDIVGHIIPAGIFLIIWGFLTLYVFRISYIRKLVRSVHLTLRNLKTALQYLLAFLLPKAVIEGVLGFVVSADYFNQTYLAQGSRYIPLAGFFDLFAGIIKDFTNEKPDFVVFYVPLIFIFTVLLFYFSRGEKLKRPSVAGPLLVVSSVMYLLAFPVIPNMRFIYPMVLTAYLAFFESLPDGLEEKKLVALAFAIALVFGVADYGVAYNYRDGKLLLAWAGHSKDLRDDLGEYIQNTNLHGTYLSVNPFNAYYLNLRIDPYCLDTFGIIYMGNSSRLWETVNKSDYMLFSTWMYTMSRESKVFEKTFGKLKERAVVNGSLLYAESYSKGDVIELFSNSGESSHVIGFSSFFGKLQLWVNGSEVAYVYPSVGNVTYSWRTTIKKSSNGEYDLVYYSRDGNSIAARLSREGNSLTLSFPVVANLTIEFKKNAVAIQNGKLLREGTRGKFTVFYPEGSFSVEGDGTVTLIASSKVVLQCGEVRIEAEN
ncbi:glycosyltransferase family 39 protein [Thermococcus waiotapuensis]|uniref:Glycosyltransferase family 39 protein n=1 Tax=Thermococcus waiotapuensis TaxID=90909 RepID=A0AAE4NUT5_9EURY|nr:glycosyltransferase family 39 protein [Thermococcus waiotapuensis]MDV3104773.1 glycosyltransferase family 39 protein [Thermococcus waiotapuensis]